jgi:hypothetical protein
MDSGVVEPSSLCDYCRPVFSLDRSLGRTIPYGRKDLHPDYPALKISIAAGCEACPLLRYALQQNINIKQLRKAHSVESSVDRVIIKEIDKTFYPPSLADVRANWTLSKLHVLVLWQERIDVDIWLHVYADEGLCCITSRKVHI